MPRSKQRGRRKRNRGWFKAGFDPRRHLLTTEERRRGGLSCARKFTCQGRWHPDWWERCRRKKKNDKGEYVDGEEENGLASADGDESSSPCAGAGCCTR